MGRRVVSRVFGPVDFGPTATHGPVPGREGGRVGNEMADPSSNQEDTGGSFMNEVHLRGQIKTQPWTYDGNLYARISVRRDTQRPNRPARDGGGFDYVTVLFPGGVQQGLELRKNQMIAVHGWLQSRDVYETLSDFLQRAASEEKVEPALSPKGETQPVHRSIVEVVADRWSVER